MSLVYRLSAERDLTPPGAVVEIEPNAWYTLICPCRQRLIGIRQPPHKIQFDADGAMTVWNSLGSPASVPYTCHLYIRGGRPEFGKDANCPGSSQ